MKISILATFMLTLLLGLSPVRCSDKGVKPGAEQIDNYLSLIGEKSFALVANHASLVDGVHLLDTLLNSGISPDQLEKIFCPEHGFRGEKGAGVMLEDHRDPQSGLPVVSIYGSNRKPTPAQMAGLDLILFDLQDVGTRFYTYISTLHYVMEACAENDVKLVVLDRPNPNLSFVDGPLMEPEYVSFVGMHPIPVVYGMTIGELAKMINGEGWLKGGVHCDLTIVPVEKYSRNTPYSLPVNPSPNLANDHAIHLYPSTCFFEGTVLSEGRGTAMPFEVYGHPDLSGDFSFTPESIEGVAINPKFKGDLCFGRDLRGFNPPAWNQIFLEFIVEAYEAFPDKENFFLPYFETLAGTASLRQQIIEGYGVQKIRSGWKKDLDAFKESRSKYLIYR